MHFGKAVVIYLIMSDLFQKHSSSNESERKNNTTYYYNILKVSEASENDTGRYTCNISSEHFLSNSAFIDIIVVGKMFLLIFS